MGHIGAMRDRRARRAVYAMRVCIVACIIVLPTTAAVFAGVAFGGTGHLVARRRAGSIH
jgi:hypothetical protein